MQTILDYTKEIIDEILKYEDEIELTITKDSIRIINEYQFWTIVNNITFSDGSFKVWTDYGGHIINGRYRGHIVEGQFDTVKKLSNSFSSRKVTKCEPS